MRAESFGHPALAFLPLLLFTEEAHSPEHWPLILARKENRGGGYVLLSKGGSMGAPAKTLSSRVSQLEPGQKCVFC